VLTTVNRMPEQRSVWGGGNAGRLGGAYDFAVEREWLARPGGFVLGGTDTRLLYDSIRMVGDSVVRGAGFRQDLAIGFLSRAGVFGVGGTIEELRGWLTDAGLRIDHIQRSGCLAHFTATAA
jgi:hypothetical protein